MDPERILGSLYVPPCAPPPPNAYEVDNTKKVTESGKIVIVPASLRLAKRKMRSNGGGGRDKAVADKENQHDKTRPD